jgi:phosphoribosylaminoimidazole-succinocarboxamide synthase
MFELDTLQRLAEGKTKIIFAHPTDDSAAIMYLKDDITAGDGLKHDVIEGKGRLDWMVNRDAFELFHSAGLPTHYIASPQERFVVVRKLHRKINLEVVTRRVAAGSIVQWGAVAAGTRFKTLVTEFYYKDDSLHDPKLDDRYVDLLIQKKGSKEFDAMRKLNAKAFETLESAFAKQGFQLIDIKLEYGFIDGEPCIIDEVSAGSLRLWPYRVESPDLEKDNILDVLSPEACLDKDIYRRGGTLTQVSEGFRQVAELTNRFRTDNASTPQ